MGQLDYRVQGAYNSIKGDLPQQIRLGVVLGSAQGGSVEFDKPPLSIPYANIAGFPQPTAYQASGHAKEFLVGQIGGTDTVIASGRYHFYEGYNGNEIALPIRLMRRMGVDTVLLTNAAGGIYPLFRVGDLMFITDHLTIFLPPAANPLNFYDREFGEPHIPQVPGILYDRPLINVMKTVARGNGIRYKEGGYAFLPGPQFESGADVKFLMFLMVLAGVRAVGMSTVPEAMAAHQAGMRVGGISGITNTMSWSGNPTSDAEVKAQAGTIGPKVNALVHGLVKELYK